MVQYNTVYYKINSELFWQNITKNQQWEIAKACVCVNVEIIHYREMHEFKGAV